MEGIDLSALGVSGVSGWDLLWAVLCAVAGWVASIFVRRGVLAVLRRTPNVSEGVAVFVARVAKYLVILLGVGIGLGFLGIGLQPLLAIVLIVGVVLVLALRGIADNFAAGVVLQTRHPVRLGDEIELDGETGTVVELNGRSVVIHTLDGRTVHIPNSTVLSQPIDNHSSRGARRSEVQVRTVRDGVDLTELTERLAHAAASVDGVHAREPARTLVAAVSSDRVTIRVQFWHHPLKGVAVTSDVVVALARALDDAGVKGVVTSIPGDPPLVPPEPL